MRFKDFCKIKSAKRIFENEYVPTGIPFIRGQEISDNSIKNGTSFSCYITKERYKELKELYGVPQYNDILITAVGTIGNLCFVDFERPFYYKDGNIIQLTDWNLRKVYPKYIFYFMQSDYFHKLLNNKLIGAVQKALTMDMLNDIEIKLPDIEEQKKIVNKLDPIINKISLNTSICLTLESMAKLLYDYWFVQFDFPDENGKPYKSSGGKMVWNDELKREIPKGWEVKRFGDILSFIKGRIPDELLASPDRGCISPYITIDVANNGLPQYCNPTSMVQCNGEVIMVMDGAASGDVYLGNVGSLGSTFSMLPSKRIDIKNAMIYMLLKANMNIYKRANTGSTVPHANRSFIEKMRVALPTNASLLSERFDLLFNRIISARLENRQLASLRDFLLPMLMNGQVKVA